MADEDVQPGVSRSVASNGGPAAQLPNEEPCLLLDEPRIVKGVGDPRHAVMSAEAA